MGEKCLELADEFESKGIDKCFYYNKTNLHKLDIYEILRVKKGILDSDSAILKICQ